MDKAKRDRFASLHSAAEPLLIYNAWDAGSAAAIAAAGAPAVATGSLGVAGAQGHADGQLIPLADLLATARSIVRAVAVPVSIDFESGYAVDPATLTANAALLAETGAVGCNFEDQNIGGDGLYAPDIQAKRIAAVASSGLFVNARTDLFLDAMARSENPNQTHLVDQAIQRAGTYADAGAGSLFVPGLSDPELIKAICKAVSLPVNVMMLPGMPEPSKLGELGAARVSWGPGPWRAMMAQLEQDARAIFTAN